MKTILSITRMSFLALAFMVISCSGSDDGGGGGGTAANGTITAKVNGSGFTSMSLGSTAQKVAVGGSYTLTLQGTSSSLKTMILILNGVNLTTGTYEIGGDNNINVVASYTEQNVNNPTQATVYAAPFEGGGVAGSVTITEITDTKVVGTFHFTGKNQNNQSQSKEITNGAFNLNFAN